MDGEPRYSVSIPGGSGLGGTPVDINVVGPEGFEPSTKGL